MKLVSKALSTKRLKLKYDRLLSNSAFKPTLKAPGYQRLKVKCDVLLSTSAFNSTCAATPRSPDGPDGARDVDDTAGHLRDGAYRGGGGGGGRGAL